MPATSWLAASLLLPHAQCMPFVHRCRWLVMIVVFLLPGCTPSDGAQTDTHQQVSSELIAFVSDREGSDACLSCTQMAQAYDVSAAISRPCPILPGPQTGIGSRSMPDHRPRVTST